MSRLAVRWRQAPASGHLTSVRRCRQCRSATTIRTSSRGSWVCDLVDVTYSGATTANLLREPQNGAPPQADALDGSEELVTVTIGGNDVGYVPLLFAAGLPRLARSLPLIGGRLREKLDPTARDRALVEVGESLKEVGRTLRQRAPRAKVLFVDYLTLLPPDGAAPPLSDVDVALGRRVADTLERLTGEAAADTGCEWVRAARRQPRAPRLVGRTVDDQMGIADAGPNRSAAPQRGRHARGGGSHRVVIGAGHRETYVL